MAVLLLSLSAAASSGAAQSSRQDRWQLTRTDGSHLWDLHLVRVSGDTLIVEQQDSLIRIHVGAIDELRLVQSFEQKGPAGQRSAIAGLAGADDTVVKLTLFTVEERRRLITELLRVRTKPPSATSPPDQ
jgi:hypothetical protein